MQVDKQDATSTEGFKEQLEEFVSEQGGSVHDVIALAAKFRGRFLRLKEWRTRHDAMVADCLGQLDQLATEGGDDEHKRTVVASLSAKLSFLSAEAHARNTEEQYKQHLVNLEELESEKADGMLVNLSQIADAVRVLVNDNRKISANPDHTRVFFRGMGLQVELSGDEKDPMFQQIARKIDKVSSAVSEARLRDRVEAVVEDAIVKAQSEEWWRAGPPSHYDPSDETTRRSAMKVLAEYSELNITRLGWYPDDMTETEAVGLCRRWQRWAGAILYQSGS